MSDSVSVFPNGIIGSNKRYYLFLQTWPLIFLIHCKLSEREPWAAMPYKGSGCLAKLSSHPADSYRLVGG